MPKVAKPRLYDRVIIDEYNYIETRNIVLQYFSKYRTYSVKIEAIESSYCASLSNDNLGITSSKVNDPTFKKATQLIEYQNYIDNMNKKLRGLRLKLTEDEKTIFNFSILSNHTDEELAEELALDKTNIYHRKKSCFIKVAQYFNLEVFK